jgi:cell division protein FtsB
MKTTIKILGILVLLMSTSCRDTKKEEAETDAMVKEVEAIEAEVNVIKEDMDTKAQALEEALKELDSI